MALILGAPVGAFVDLFEGETREDREIEVFSSITNASMWEMAEVMN